MKNIVKQLGLLLTIPVLLIVSACDGQQRGLVVRNNRSGFQQDTREMGHSSRGTQQNRSGATNPFAGGVNMGNAGQNNGLGNGQTQPGVGRTDKKASTSVAAPELVIEAPMSAEKLCKEVGAMTKGIGVSLKIWGKTIEGDKDLVSNDCEAVLMGARYSNDLFQDTELYASLQDYYAIHPKRLNGFLVGAAYFPEKHFTKKRNRAKDDRDIRRLLKENRKRNSEFGENERITKYNGVSIPDYTYELWEHFFELKNEGEGDLPAFRRIFFGSLTEEVEGEESSFHDVAMNPKNTRFFKGYDRKFDVTHAKVVEDQKLTHLFGAVENSNTNPKDNIPEDKSEHVAIVSREIPFPVGTSNVSLGKLAGIFEETNSLRQNGNFMYIAETNLVIDEPIELAIGHLREVNGKSYVQGITSGTIVGLVDGQTKLIGTDQTLQNDDREMANELRTKVDPKSGDCRSVHFAMIFLPNSEKFADEVADHVLAESIFYRKVGDTSWYPLHEGITSVSPVALSKDGSCKVDANERIFNEMYVQALKKDPALHNKTEYYGDHFVYINEPSDAGTAVEVQVEEFGSRQVTVAAEDITLTMEDGSVVQIDPSEITKASNSTNGIQITTIRVPKSKISGKLKKIQIAAENGEPYTRHTTMAVGAATAQR